MSFYSHLPNLKFGLVKLLLGAYHYQVFAFENQLIIVQYQYICLISVLGLGLRKPRFGFELLTERKIWLHLYQHSDFPIKTFHSVAKLHLGKQHKGKMLLLRLDNSSAFLLTTKQKIVHIEKLNF